MIFSGFLKTTDKIGYIKCVLNSDVFFKSVARIIEALQTHKADNIKYVLSKEYPLWTDECKKCLGEE